MKINSGEIIKKMRKEMGLSQEDFAQQLFISVRQLARIESGEANMDVWQFISTLELLGHPTEDFWLLYLSSSEYDSYRSYKRLKLQLKNGSMSEASGIIADIEKGPLIKQPFIRQFIAMVKAASNPDTPPAQALEELLQVMRMSKPHYDESKISEYRMTYNEVSIALCMTGCMSDLGQHDRAASIIQAMIKSRESAQVSEEDKAAIFPFMYFVLSQVLIEAGRFGEALKVCNQTLDMCREYNNMKNIPEILFSIANCYFKLGEEEHIYKTHLVRAYHAAYAIGKNEAAKRIKDDAETVYGVVIA